MSLSLIVAAAENGIIGVDGELPWRLSNDLKRFRQLTTGHHIIMGRKTYESINRLLPDRTTVIVTRNQDYEVPGAIVVNSVDEAVKAVADDSEPFVIGGAEIYRAVLPQVDRIYLTHVKVALEGDAVFPSLDPEQWAITEQQEFPADEKNEYPTVFCIYQRKQHR